MLCNLITLRICCDKNVNCSRAETALQIHMNNSICCFQNSQIIGATSHSIVYVSAVLYVFMMALVYYLSPESQPHKSQEQANQLRQRRLCVVLMCMIE